LKYAFVVERPHPGLCACPFVFINCSDLVQKIDWHYESKSGSVEIKPHSKMRFKLVTAICLNDEQIWNCDDEENV